MKLHLIKNNKLNKENFFNKRELQEILNLYGSMVSAGEWKDYGIYMSKTMISFEIYRKATENPLFQILKKLNQKDKKVIWIFRFTNTTKSCIIAAKTESEARHLVSVEYPDRQIESALIFKGYDL